jgi:DNA polymerase III epsilon subunit-like protein
MSAYIANLPDLSRGYCVIDTETSGLDPEHDRVIEVAVLVNQTWPERSLRNGKATVRTALVKSVEIVPQVITEVTGIDTETLQREGKPPAEVFQALFNLPALQSLPIVGHNIIDFDWPFLLREAFRHLDRDTYHSKVRDVLTADRLIDTGALYKGIRLGEEPFLGEDHYGWAVRVMAVRASGLYWNLRAAARSMGVQTRRLEAHRARNDVILCHHLLEKILESQATSPGQSRSKL